MAKTPLPAVPSDRNMISYTIRTEGEPGRRTHIAVMEYPDCTREFDGRVWRVTHDKRK